MADKTRKVNWFAIWVSAAVVVALVLVAWLVVSLNSAAENPEPGQTPSASNIEVETGAILVGDGPDRLDTFIDFMCPVCGQFEQVYGEEIQGLADDGTITLGIHPISILDSRSQGTEFSTRAANAMYCVAEADADAATPFMAAMFANQPTEGVAGLTDDQLLEIAAVRRRHRDRRVRERRGVRRLSSPPSPRRLRFSRVPRESALPPSR